MENEANTRNCSERLLNLDRRMRIMRIASTVSREGTVEGVIDSYNRLVNRLTLNLPPEEGSLPRHMSDVDAFLADRCDLCPDAEGIQAKDLYGAFREWWLEERSGDPPSMRRFGEAMQTCCERRKSNVVTYMGLRLKDR